MLAVNLIGFAVWDVKPIFGVPPMTDGREKGALGLLARGRCCADLCGDRPAKTLVYGTGRSRLMAWALKALLYRLARMPRDYPRKGGG